MEHELKFKESSPDSRMVIPSEVLEESGISAAQCAELHQLRHCVAVLQEIITLQRKSLYPCGFPPVYGLSFYLNRGQKPTKNQQTL